ncbi:hypothetical protein ACLOJK_030778 [Asimina triloba]
MTLNTFTPLVARIVGFTGAMRLAFPAAAWEWGLRLRAHLSFCANRFGPLSLVPANSCRSLPRFHRSGGGVEDFYLQLLSSRASEEENGKLGSDVEASRGFIPSAEAEDRGRPRREADPRRSSLGLLLHNAPQSLSKLCLRHPAA